MDTEIRVSVKISFKLPDLDAREALEQKIDTFINAQDPGSTRDNICRDTPEDPDHPFWFQTKMSIVAKNMNKVSGTRNMLLNSLDNMGEVISYDFWMHETKAD